MAGDVTSFYRDIRVRAGTTLLDAYEIAPLDLTGCSATAHVQTLGNFPVVLTTTNVGVTPHGRFDFDVVDTVTAGWAPGIYSYRVDVTFAGGQVLTYSYGFIEVLA